MGDFAAFVSWPTAPLTERLVRTALESLTPQPPVITALNADLVASPGRLLQWATYDALDHDLTFSHSPASRVLSSSYVIRKALIRKHFLSRCIHNYLTKHPDSILTWGAPRTWELEISFADELDELWGDDLYDLSEEIEKGDPAKWWILKPGMADRGMGLRLFHTKEDLQAIFEEFEQDESEEEGTEEDDNDGRRDTAVVTSQLRHFVIQEYLGNPLLLDPAEVPLDGSPAPPPQDLRGHKFHLRVYCVASGAIKVYVYDQILALFSAVPYASPSRPEDDTGEIDLSAHLTNTSLQTERGEAGVRLLNELVGCHVLSSSQPRRQQPKPRHAMGQAMDVDSINARRAEATKYSTVSAEDVSDIKGQICEVLSETFKAAVEMSVHFQPLPNAFELFGIDFVVTHDPSPDAPRKFQVNLLEVNSEPAIELTGPRLTWILEDLFKAIAKTCVAPFFSAEGSPIQQDVDGWKVGEVKENMRKCLDMQVRGAQGW
ncbi:tubulin-tyrosine ligase [Cubamyces menziesii]|nr:tubulin-tyrosine ligase [Cubamyces menziesii]